MSRSFDLVLHYWIECIGTGSRASSWGNVSHALPWRLCDSRVAVVISTLIPLVVRLSPGRHNPAEPTPLKYQVTL